MLTTGSLPMQKGDKFFIVAIENVKVMQNVKSYELKTIIKLTFVQESGPTTSG